MLEAITDESLLEDFQVQGKYGKGALVFSLASRKGRMPWHYRGYDR